MCEIDLLSVPGACYNFVSAEKRPRNPQLAIHAANVVSCSDLDTEQVICNMEMNVHAYLSEVQALVKQDSALPVATARVLQGQSTLDRSCLDVPFILVPLKPLRARFNFGRRTMSYTLRRGDLAILPVNLSGTVELGFVEAVAAVLSLDALEATAVALDARTSAVKLRAVECTRDVLLAAMVEELSREQSNPAGTRPYYADALGRSILSRVVTHYAEIDFASPPATRSGDERIMRARTFIEHNLSGDLSLDGVARHAGLSKPHLTELFRSATGLTVWQYVKRRRLMRARQMLSSTKAGIPDIAAQLGYRSVSHFSQSFRAEFGIGPGAYRSTAVIRTGESDIV